MLLARERSGRCGARPFAIRSGAASRCSAPAISRARRRASAALDTAEGAYDQGNALGHARPVRRRDEALRPRPRAAARLAGRRGEPRDRAHPRRAQEGEGGDTDNTESKPDEIVFDKTKKGGEDTTVEGEQPMSDEAVRALWLKRVQTRPADFLRVKFAYQLQTRGAGAAMRAWSLRSLCSAALASSAAGAGAGRRRRAHEARPGRRRRHRPAGAAASSTFCFPARCRVRRGSPSAMRRARRSCASRRRPSTMRDRIDGQAYVGQSFEFVVFPRRGGAIAIPAAEVDAARPRRAIRRLGHGRADADRRDRAARHRRRPGRCSPTAGDGDARAGRPTRDAVRGRRRAGAHDRGGRPRAFRRSAWPISPSPRRRRARLCRSAAGRGPRQSRRGQGPPHRQGDLCLRARGSFRSPALFSPGGISKPAGCGRRKGRVRTVAVADVATPLPAGDRLERWLYVVTASHSRCWPCCGGHGQGLKAGYAERRARSGEGSEPKAFRDLQDACLHGDARDVYRTFSVWRRRTDRAAAVVPFAEEINSVVFASAVWSPAKSRAFVQGLEAERRAKQRAAAAERPASGSILRR